MTDCFTILGASADSSVDDLKEAWRKLVKTAHPDAGGSAEEFIRLRKAYIEALSIVSTAEPPANTVKPKFSGDYIKCQYCGGSGRLGNFICHQCGGSGKNHFYWSV